jgi:hypothetical protein
MGALLHIVIRGLGQLYVMGRSLSPLPEAIITALVGLITVILPLSFYGYIVLNPTLSRYVIDDTHSKFQFQSKFFSAKINGLCQ